MATAVADPADTPTPDALISRARAMVSTLKVRAESAAKECCIPTDSIREMKEAGFFRVLQPKRWGGYEMDPQVFYEIQMALAEGCMSTAWVYGVVGVHPFQLALFDAKAQHDVWAKDDAALLSSSYQPVGKVERVDGGFQLSGRWGFSSGCDHCDWVLLGSFIPPPQAGAAPDMRTFLLPRKDYKIVHDWNVFGLQATGSHGIVVDKAFVPEYRTHRAIDGFALTNPGQAVNTAPLYRVPWAQVFVRAVSSAAIGALQGALDGYKSIVAKRVSTNTGQATKSDPAALNAAARTQSAILEMKSVLHRNFDEIMASVRAGREIPLLDRVRYRYESSQIGRRCADLCDELMPLLGGRAIYMDSPVVRYWLDINAARAHVANDPRVIGSALGAMYVGEQVQEFFV
ncbi:MAG TPA: acyl-CoA dehydrogenase family protein [Steroidobacteraceae bacterium]|nr:acyl-CoA dehydrogenase family protein [Steroidobacteraceae bacterium]